MLYNEWTQHCYDVMPLVMSLPDKHTDIAELVKPKFLAVRSQAIASALIPDII